MTLARAGASADTTADGVLVASTEAGELSAHSDLRFSTDSDPGISRRRAGRGFRYYGPHGRPIRDATVLARIRALAIPPAWRDVWICADPRGHLQATGHDARGRKQSCYHHAWRQRRDKAKFSRLPAFGRALPKIRRRVKRDLARPGLSKDKVLATVVQLLETTAVRVGNKAYVRSNASFGLTTLRNRHVSVTGSALRLRFRGKNNKMHDVGVHDRRLAGIVARCGSLPGQELFQYLDEDDEPRPIESADVNAYLQDAAGMDITAKDYRTWIGTLVAFHELRSMSNPAPRAGPRAMVTRSLEAVAGVLGNTPAVSRQSYVAPIVVDSYLAGSLPPGRIRVGERPEQGPIISGRREELALVRFLEHAGRRTTKPA